MPSHKIEFQGKDVAEAIKNACKGLKVSQEELDIEVLNTGSRGIFGLGKQKVRLLVCRKKGGAKIPPTETPFESVIKEELGSDGDQPKGHGDSKKTAKKPAAKKARPVPPAASKPAASKPAAPEPAAPEPAAPEPAVPEQAAPEPAVEVEAVAGEVEKPAPADTGRAGGTVRPAVEISPEVREEVKDQLSKMLELMGCPSEIAVREEENSVVLHIAGDYEEEVVGPEGRVLDGLQYLVRKMAAKRYSDKLIISLDAGEFRANRLHELGDIAKSMAEEVKKNGKTKAIPSLNPAERRIVHMALQGDKEIRSRSVGEGLFKKVLIYRPGRGGRKGGSRKRRSK